MKRRAVIFKPKMFPLAKSVPTSIAASIGRTLLRHTYMEYLQRRILDTLLEISIKQGRLTMRLPQPRQYPKLVRALLQFHSVYVDDKALNKLGAALDAADRARNTLAHSVVTKDPDNGKYAIQVVRGTWELEQDVFSVERALQPQMVMLDTAYLKASRKDVEKGIVAMMELGAFIRKLMKTLHETRRTQAALDRRRRPQSQNTHPTPPQSSGE